MAAWLAAFAVPLRAQTPAGTSIVNIALGSHSDPVAGAPPGARVVVPSNPVTTVVSNPACLGTAPVLSVTPAGTVPPGTSLEYRVLVTNDTAVPLINLRLDLPLDPGLLPPAPFTDGTAPRTDGAGSVPVNASYDPLAHILAWDVPSLDPGVGIMLNATAAVDPALAADSVVAVSASSGSSGCSTSLTSNTVSNAVVPPVLRVTKRADRRTAVPGDTVGYRLVVTHAGSAPDLDPVELIDVLPDGLRYVPGSARLDGAPVPDPEIGSDGRTLTFTLGPLAPGQTRRLALAAWVVAGARKGDAVNRVHASAVTAGGAVLAAAPAAAAVRLFPGPFRREAQLVGRVFLDDDGDRLPGAAEPGVPGVRVMLEDGRGAITDVDGRWHLEGVSPGLHVLRLDPSTLPGDLAPADGGADWASNPTTRFLEVRATTLALTDFPIGPAGAARCRLVSGNARLVLPRASLLDASGRPRAGAVAWLEAAAGRLAARGAVADGVVRVRCSTTEGPLTDEEELRRRLRSALESRGVSALDPLGEPATTDPPEVEAPPAPPGEATPSPGEAGTTGSGRRHPGPRTTQPATLDGEDRRPGPAPEERREPAASTVPAGAHAPDGSSEADARSMLPGTVEPGPASGEPASSGAPPEASPPDRPSTETATTTEPDSRPASRAATPPTPAEGSTPAAAGSARTPRAQPPVAGRSDEAPGRPARSPGAGSRLRTKPERESEGTVPDPANDEALVLSASVSGETGLEPSTRSRGGAAPARAGAGSRADAARSAVAVPESAGLTGTGSAPREARGGGRLISARDPGAGAAPPPSARKRDVRAEEPPAPPADVSAAPTADPDAPFAQVLRTAPAGAVEILAPAGDSRAPRDTVDVDVLYPAGAKPKLRVNDEPVPDERIGISSELPSRELAASRYVGVPLQPGENRVTFTAVTGDGALPAVERVIRLPGSAVELRLRTPHGHWVADGTTPGELIVEAVDAAGVRSADRLAVTLLAEGAIPLTADLDPRQDGLQLRLADGRARLHFAPPTVPGRVRLTVLAEELQAELFVDVVPSASRWTVLGLAEGRLAQDGGVEGDGGTGPGDGDPLRGDGARLALFARGPVGRASRLTLSVDSERERNRDRLFPGRFEPDRYYPVYGDASARVDEASTQGEVFARLDTPAGHVQWGDFATRLERTELLRYDRRLHGASGRVRAGRFSFRGFAASSEQRAARDVFAADGTSGPYRLTRRPIVARSETVVIETRDRYRSDRVLARETRRPDVDYELDTEAGTLLFHAPLSPFDRERNPRRIVVLYETRAPAAERLASGGRATFDAGPVEAGASAVYEERDGVDLALFGVDAVWRPVPGTLVRAELAGRADDDAPAVRAEVHSRPSDALAWELSYRDVDLGFDNPSVLAAPESGTRQAGGSLTWHPAGDWRVHSEAFDQLDRATGLRRRAAGAEAERRFGRVSAVAGLRAADAAGAGLGNRSATLAKAGIRGRLGGRWLAELSREENLGQAVPGFPDRTAAEVAFTLREGTRLFLRHEAASGGAPARDRTLLGIDSRVAAHTRATASYGLDGGADGTALRSQTGVETALPLGTRGTARFSAARFDTVSGDDAADFTSVGGGYEYRAGPSLLTARYELRRGRDDSRHLLSAAGAVRPVDAWTFFVRERWFVTERNAGRTSGRAEGLVGSAWRPRGGNWRFLARADHATTGGGVVATSGATSAGGVPPEPAASATTGVPEPGPPGIGVTAPRDAPVVGRDSVALSLAFGARLSARQRIAGAVVGRRVGADRLAGIPASHTGLVSLHYTAAIHPRWTLGGSVRRFEQRESGTRTYGHGIEVGRQILRDVWLTGGYSFAGFRDDGFPAAGRTGEGAFLSLRAKFDEHSLSRFTDLRLDRP